MASEILNQNRSFITGATALAAYVRVKLTAGLLVVAGAGESAIGVTVAPSAISAAATVRLFNGYGTAFMVASAAVTSGNPVYGTASGKIDDAVASTNAGAPLGIALEAATADLDVIEVLLAGRIPVLAPLASVDQAVSTNEASVVLLANSIRTALINHGIIKGGA